MLKNHKIIGLKLFPGHERFYPTDKICQSVYKLALKYDCPVVFHTGINSGNLDCAKYNNPKFIVEVAKKYPNIKIIIAHYFWPRMDYCFEITKDIPNIYYDTSAMADYEVVGLSGGLEKVVDILEKTAKIKSYSIIFGSDFDMCDQKAHIELIQKLMLPSIAKDDIFCNNFRKCFGNAVK